MKISTQPSLQFIFAMFAVLTAIGVFVPMTSDAKFVSGILQISLGAGAFVGAVINLLRGDPHGNIDLVLSVILGFASGITQLAGVIAAQKGLHFHPWVLSVVLMMGGLFMLCMLPMLNKGQRYVQIAHGAVSLAFLCSGISDLAEIPWLKLVSGCLLIVFACGSFYQGVHLMYAAMKQ